MLKTKAFLNYYIHRYYSYSKKKNLNLFYYQQKRIYNYYSSNILTGNHVICLSQIIIKTVWKCSSSGYIFKLL